MQAILIETIPAAIVAIITLAGVIYSNNSKDSVRAAKIDARFDAVEKSISDLQQDFASLNQHVKEHNNLSVRMSVMEQRADAADARIKQLERKGA